MRLAVLALALTSCRPFPAHHASCLFGADSAEAEAACARQNFGPMGVADVLRSVNRRVLLQHPEDCVAHVAMVAASLEPYGYEVEPIYSKSHVSALVTDPVTGK